jgi:hypothetical protein
MILSLKRQQVSEQGFYSPSRFVVVNQTGLLGLTISELRVVSGIVDERWGGDKSRKSVGPIPPFISELQVMAGIVDERWGDNNATVFLKRTNKSS